jgi:hypothetical protein
MAYNFNGTTQYLSNNSSPLGNSPTLLTFACNVKGSPAASSLIMGLMRTSNNTPFILLRAEANSTDIGFFYREDNGTTRYLPVYPGVFPTATFKHVAAVVDNVSGVIYLNGVSGIPFPKVGSFSTTLNAFCIGALMRSPVVNYFNGDIAEVGIWNAALTADEIASLSRGMTCDKVRPQNLVFYAPLVRDLIDVKSGLILTNNNGATAADHPRIYA